MILSKDFLVIWKGMFYINLRMLRNAFWDWNIQDCHCPDTQNVFCRQKPYNIGHVNLWFVLVLTVFASHYHKKHAVENCINNITCGPREITQAGSQTVINTRNKHRYPAFWSQMELIYLEVAGFFTV